MIESEQVTEIADWLSQQPLNQDTIQTLRQRYPQMHFSYCMDDDVGAVEPIHQHSAFNLYLLDSSQHCLTFTQNLSAASGLLVAEVIDEDEV